MSVYEPGAAGEQTISNVVVTPQRVRTKPERGTTAWALQRLSAYGLVVCLAVHMWFNHFANISTGNRLTFEIVNRRFELYPLIYAINDIALLTLALFHGLNGVRNVIYDWSTSSALRRASTIVLVIVGAVFLWDGALTLLALMELPTTQ
jgi:succinate dehydrogenase / fumarate reductase, membrane anchor subunit